MGRGWEGRGGGCRNTDVRMQTQEVGHEQNIVRLVRLCVCVCALYVCVYD